MTPLVIFIGLTAAVLALFLVSQVRSRRATFSATMDLPETSDRAHATYVHPIRQALSEIDSDFLAVQSLPSIANRVRSERRRVVLSYLDSIQEDFEKLLSVARVIALLSPKVEASHEWQRLRLSTEFRWRLFWMRMRLRAGNPTTQQLSSIADMVSGLAVRLDAAILQLGERAALVSEITSAMDRNRLNLR